MHFSNYSAPSNGQTNEEVAMGDDLDDLLDEVEHQFIKSPPQKIAATAKIGHDANLKRSLSDDAADLDQLISDICCDDDDGDGNEIASNSRANLASKQTSGSHKKRCFPVLLGGSQITMGHSDASAQRSCDQLRCTSCDFHVIWFDDRVWHSRSDYLFFRNNVPDHEKLKKYLVRKKGYRAYACQCSWQSTMEVVDLSTLANLKWVCGKH